MKHVKGYGMEVAFDGDDYELTLASIRTQKNQVETIVEQYLEMKRRNPRHWTHKAKLRVVPVTITCGPPSRGKGASP